MTALVIFADAEDTVGTWLQTALAAHGRSRPVSTKGPDDFNRAAPGRGEYVRIQAIGGSPAGVTLEDVLFTIESYADDVAAAIATAEVCRALLAAAPRLAGSPIYATEQVSRPQSLPDPRTGMSRYTQTISVRIRGTVI